MADPGKELSTRLAGRPAGSPPEETTVAAWLRELEFPLNTRTGLWARGMACITWLVTVLMVVLPNWPMVPVLPMKEVCGAEKLGLVLIQLNRIKEF